MSEDTTFSFSPRCFGCGDQNPRGLRLGPLVEVENDEIVIRTTIHEDFAGFVNVVHGGIVAAILDEAMSHHIMRVQETRHVMTAKPARRLPGPGPDEDADRGPIPKSKEGPQVRVRVGDPRYGRQSPRASLESLDRSRESCGQLHVAGDKGSGYAADLGPGFAASGGKSDAPAKQPLMN